MERVELREYRMSFFLEIRHSFDGSVERMHDHTVEIRCKITIRQQDIVQFDDVEAVVERCVGRYDKQILNNLPQLSGDSTIEHLGEVMCYEIDDEIRKFGYEMNRFEISETPLRTYIITDELRD